MDMRKWVNGLLSKRRVLSEPVKASVWYMICNVLNKGIALLSTPIFTRLLTEEQYGKFAIFQSWYSIILIFTSLNIFMGGYTKGLLLYRDDKERLTSSLLSLTTLITCCFGIVYLINIDFWTDVFELSPMLMSAMFLELIVMPAVEFWAAKEKFDFKYKKYVLISLLTTAFSLCGGILAVINTSHKLEARIFSDILGKAIFAVVIFVMLLSRGKTFFNKEYWLYALKFNIPLLPHYLSNYVLNQSDRIMIGRMVGNDKAAFYSVAYTISTMMMLIITAINNSLTPYLYKAIDDVEHGNETFEAMKKKVMSITHLLFVLVAGLCVATMAFAPEIIFVFAGEKYTEAIYVIPPIAASTFFIFTYVMFSTIEYYFQKTGRIALATTACALLNLFLNYIFIRRYGYYAAGYTTLACYMALSLMHYIFYKAIIRRKMPGINSVYDIKVIIMITVIVLGMMFIMIFTYKLLEVRYGIILIMTLLVVMKRKYLLQVFHAFKK